MTGCIHPRSNCGLGAGEFIMKPYVIERLDIAVRKELDRKR
jgi:hypothetical protein